MSFIESVKQAKLLWSDSPEATIAALESLKPDNPTDAVNYWRTYVVHKEWHERIKRGLMPYHSHDISDMFFRYVDLEPYGAAAAAAGAPMDLACYGLCKSDRALPEKLFRLFEDKGHVAGTTRFQPEFHNTIAMDKKPPDLPVVRFHQDVVHPGPIIWLACDSKYLAFALPMIRSLRAVTPGVACHLHVFNPEICEWPADIGISTEVCPANKGYYHAVRFIRLYEFQRRFDRPVWLMDVDGLFNNHPQPLFDMLQGVDVAFRARPARLEPWNQLNACVVGFNNNPGGTGYLRGIAQYIQQFLPGLAWGIDQTAMFCVFEHLKPKVATLDELHVDYDYRPNGVVWCNSSNKKWAHLEGITDPSRRLYFEKFQAFSPARI